MHVIFKSLKDNVLVIVYWCLRYCLVYCVTILVGFPPVMALVVGVVGVAVVEGEVAEGPRLQHPPLMN